MTDLSDAVGYARASNYSGSGDWLDQSGNGHDAQLGSTSGADTNDPVFDDGTQLFIEVTTTAPNQTPQINDLTVVSQVTVDWGDGNTNDYTFGGARSHQYASAGTYQVRISDPDLISELDLADSKMTFDTVELRKCGGNLAMLSLRPGSAGWRCDSSDVAHLGVSTYLNLAFSQAGTYTIDSADFASMGVSTYLKLSFSQAGTYTIDSADFASMGVSSHLEFFFNQSGTYNIDSADFASMGASSLLRLIFSSPSATIAQADFDQFDTATTVAIQMGLTEAQVDDMLAGFEAGLATRTATGGSIYVAGSNAAPSAAGQTSRTNLLNDATHPWTTVTVN